MSEERTQSQPQRVHKGKLDGRSMIGSLAPGQEFYWRELPFDLVQPGMMMVYKDQHTGKLTIHVADEYFPDTGLWKTKGVNNRFRDRGWVGAENYRGLWWDPKTATYGKPKEEDA